MKILYFIQFSILFISANQALGAEKGMPQLDPEFWTAQIFWLILIFTILYITIWKIFLPKVTDSIENRKSKIINDLSETEKLKEFAQKKLGEYNKIIEDAKKDAKKMIEENHKKLESDLENKKQKFNKEVEKEMTSAYNEVKSFKQTSVANIQKIAKEISAEIVSKIIKTEANMSSVAALVEEISKKKIQKNQ
tara:strand:+ start:149 stop:727 length:579 start_codon:yes stop_codon:yes gene_type:complete